MSISYFERPPREFIGATENHDGYAGLVPAPRSSDYDKVLMGSGEWVREVMAAIRAQYARQIETEDAQSSYGEYIYRATGGSASLSDGDAMLIKLRGRRVHTGYVEENITYNVEPSEGSDIVVSLDEATMRTSMGGLSEFEDYYTYSTEYGWQPRYGAMNIETVGFTVTGTPVDGDIVRYTYIGEQRGTITQSSPASFVSTGWNLYDHAKTYAKVKKYSDEYGFKIGGTYTAVKFSETPSGTKTTITPASGYFTIPSDGYIWVEGGNSTDTYILMTWSDWTEGYEGSWQAYTESSVSLATIMENFSYGLCQVENVYDEIDLNLGQAISYIMRLPYSAANLMDVQATGRPYEYDNDYIYTVRATPVVYSISVDGSFTASDHGMEYVTGTLVDVYVETLYGQNLVDKLRTDVLTKSADLVNNLTTNDSTKALSAAQGYALNSNINAKDCMKLHYKEVTIGTGTLGTSFSQTAKTPGTCSTLFGLSASKIISVFGKNGSLTPASNMIFGIFNESFFMAATQTCTLSSSYTFVILYHD